MLAFAITLLLILTGIIAGLSIADSALKARGAYVQLMHEAALMHGDIAVPAPRQRRPLQRPVRAMPDRHRARLTMPPVPVCAAA